MTNTSQRRSRSVVSPAALAAGALMFALGLAGMAALLAAAYGTSPRSLHWGDRLGLAGAGCASAVAQILILVGAWFIWRGLARRR